MAAIGTLPVLFATGNHASRPAASAVGKGGIYSCTTHSLLYQTDGSSWSTWATLSGSGMSDPMTTRGDIIIRDASNVTARLGKGSANTVLSSDGTDVAYAIPLPSKAQSGASADTSLTTDTIADVTGCSVSLAAGNWLIGGVCTFDSGAGNYILAAITDSGNTKYTEGRSLRVSGSPHAVPIPVVIVSPGSTTTYKMRAQCGASGTVLRYAEGTIPGTTMWALKVV